MKSRQLLPINLKRKKKQSRKNCAQVIAAFQTFSSPLLWLPQIIWCDVDITLKTSKNPKKKLQKCVSFLTESPHVHNYILLK